MRFVGIAILLLVSVVRGQYPASSLALDQEYKILEPKESFEGVYASQNTGLIIKTVVHPESCTTWKEAPTFLTNPTHAGKAV